MYTVEINGKDFDVEKWVKEEVSKSLWVDRDNKIDISPTSYDDYISERTLLEVIGKYIDNGKNEGVPFSYFLCDFAFERFFIDTVYDIDWEVKQELLKKAEEISPDLYDMIDEIPPGELVEDIGEVGVSFDIADFLSHDYKLNLILATDTELNYDLGMIEHGFYEPVDFLLKNKDRLFDSMDNALNFLVRQQGYDVSELISDYRNNITVDNKFPKSVISELEETITDYGMSALTVCVASSGQELLDVLDNLLSDNPNKGVTVDTNTTVGFYDTWNGCGSQLDIQLEKPFVIPSDMVYNIQIEKAGGTRRGYTVDETYGLIGSVWTNGEIQAVDVGEEISKLRKPTEAELKSVLEVYKELDKKEKVAENDLD